MSPISSRATSYGEQCGTSTPEAPASKNMLAVAVLVAAQAHQRRHAAALGRDQHAVHDVDAQRRVLHVDDHEVEPGRGEDLDRLHRRELDEHADQARVGLAQTLLEVRAHQLRPQRSLLASAAPSASDFSLAHWTSGWTRIMLQPWEKPQSVPAMTFSRPTTLA